MYRIALLLVFVLPAPLVQAQSLAKVGEKAHPVSFSQSFPADYTIPESKLIVLDFWATWCGPCVAGLLETNDLVDAYAGRVAFIAITDHSSIGVKEFIKKKNFKHAFLVDTSAQTFRKYGVRSIPHAFIIDAKGYIIWSGHGGEITKAVLDNCIAGRPAAIDNKPKVAVKKKPAAPDPMSKRLLKFEVTKALIPGMEYSSVASFKPDTMAYTANMMTLRDITGALFSDGPGRIIFNPDDGTFNERLSLDFLAVNVDPVEEKNRLALSVATVLGHQAALKTIDTAVYTIKVHDAPLLDKNRTIMTSKAQIANTAGKYISSARESAVVTMLNTSLPELAKQIEERFGVIVKPGTDAGTGYDLYRVNAADFSTFRSALKTAYGLELAEAKMPVTFMVIEKKP